MDRDGRRLRRRRRAGRAGLAYLLGAVAAAAAAASMAREMVCVRRPSGGFTPSTRLIAAQVLRSRHPTVRGVAFLRDTGGDVCDPASFLDLTWLAGSETYCIIGGCWALLS